MKRILSLIILLSFGIAVFFACQKDPEPLPMNGVWEEFIPANFQAKKYALHHYEFGCGEDNLGTLKLKVQYFRADSTESKLTFTEYIKGDYSFDGDKKTGIFKFSGVYYTDSSYLILSDSTNSSGSVGEWNASYQYRINSENMFLDNNTDFLSLKQVQKFDCR